MSEHTPEPWKTIEWDDGSTGIYTNTDDRIAEIDYYDNQHDARRIVACVNACAGMDDPDTELSALRAQVEEWETIKKAFVEEYNLKNKGWTRNTLDYHSHSHDIAGVWDSDNGSLAGKKCAACMAMRAALAAAGKENV